MLPNRTELLSQLERLLGVNRWQLNLSTNVMRVEFADNFDAVHVHEVHVNALKSVLDAHEIEQHLAHWEEAAREGHSGPVGLNFMHADGSKGPIESACGLYVVNEERLLIGVFRFMPNPQKLSHHAKHLSGFLDTFIENSPSCTVVMDSAGAVISLNREFMRFLGGADRNAYLRKSLLDPLYEINTGLGTLVRKVLHSQEAERGSFEMHRGELRQTLYWRSFPLSVDKSIAPPKVFAFDMHQHGPRAA